MKVVVATNHTQGDRESDFSWTIDGELVEIGGSECRSEKCGCWRSFPGLASHKATTTAMVVNLPHITPQILRQAVADSLEAQGWLEYLTEETGDEMIEECYSNIVNIADHFPAGAIIERDQDTVTLRALSVGSCSQP